MRALMAVVAAGLVAVAIGIWSNTASRSTDTTIAKATLVPSMPSQPKAAAGISIWEMHNQAHLKNLPITEVDDQTFIFPETPRQSIAETSR